MIVMFDLLILNNWTVLKEGFCAVTSSASIWFFIANFFVGIFLVFNTVIALVIQGYEAEYSALEHIKAEASKMASDGGGNKSQYGKRLYRGASQFYEILNEEEIQIVQEETQKAVDALTPIIDSPVNGDEADEPSVEEF